MSDRLLLLCATALLIVLPVQAQSPEQWSQRVDYDMDISLHADEHQYTGHQTLTYTNNSPDTLRTVYYHLYFNAFHPESMMAERNRQLPDPDGRIVPRIFNLGPEERGWHRVRSLTQDGTPVDYDVNDTVMRVDLAEPIPPGTSTTFEMNWRAQVPLQTRRSGRDSRGDRIDFTMTQWYPKIAEYDERGWHANFYVNREYYAPFGSFDVEITLPTEYTVGATGRLQNPDEIGHGYDIDGDGTWRPADGLPDADSLTWHFTAEDVHNFAWSADPDYIHDKVTADGTTHHILYKPEVAEQWNPLKKDMPELTAFFSREYGDYPYPQMTVAQGGDGGMEYPMFTVVSSYDGPAFEETSSRRSVLGTTVHEFAHMWYYAALGSNEADYAWMDEGFTSYATSEGMAHLTGGTATHSPTSLVWLHKQGLYESLSTPADWFETNTAYGVASYPGGELVVDMLGYVMGEDNRDRWLKRYFRERKDQHPDPYDLELFAEQESGLMLDWYFWQFTRSTRELDDEIDDLENTANGNGYEASFTLEREGTVRMPHDVKLTLEDGSTQWVNVPLASMHGHKPVPQDWIVTEPWPWVQPEKTFTVTVPAPVESAELDPKGRTPDVNRLNNSTDFPLETQFLRAPRAEWTHYEVGVRPLLGYADRFGFGGGVQLRGQYYLGDHRARGMLTLWPEVLFSDGADPSLFSSSLPAPNFPTRDVAPDDGSWFTGLDYEFAYQRSFDALGPRSVVGVRAAKHLGVLENRLHVDKPLQSPLADGSEILSLLVRHQFNPSDRAFGARTHRVRFLDGNTETTGFLDNPFRQSHLLSATLSHTIEADRAHLRTALEMGGSLRDRPLSTAGSATHVTLEARKSTTTGPLRLDADLQLGLGSADLARHKQFRLGGRSVEGQWQNDAFRQGHAAFANPQEDAHLTAFGPAGPVAYLHRLDGRAPALSGSNVVAGRLTASGTPFPEVNALSPLTLEAFSGLGTVWSRGAFLAGFDADALVGDAGIGASYAFSGIPHLGRWTAQSDVLQDLDVVAKFPVWASDPDLIDPGEAELNFRWMIGLEL